MCRGITLLVVLTHDDSTVGGGPERELRRLIATSPAGAQLPSVRELTRRHRASPLTVQRAVTRLEQEGLVRAEPGRGTFVAERSASPTSDPAWQTLALGARGLPAVALADLLAPAPADTIPLATGYPDASLQALGLLATATARAARRPHAWSRVPVEGTPELRAWFAHDVGGGADPADVLVTPGGQAALATTMRALASPGDPVLVESPTYIGALEAARLAGLRAVPVPSDAGGVRTDALERALAATGASIVVLQPLVANPTGATLAADRRADVLALIREAGAFLVEDDYARSLVEPDRAPHPLWCDDADGHVVHVRSLTKSVAPGLRICGVLARGPAAERLRNTRLVDDFFVSGVLQEAAIGVVTSPGWRRHVSQLRLALATRMEAAVAGIAAWDGAQLVSRPLGGFVLWVRLPDHLDDEAFTREALQQGVVVSPGRRWFVAEPTGAFVRLSVAAADVAQVRRALGILAQLGATPIARESPRGREVTRRARV